MDNTDYEDSLDLDFNLNDYDEAISIIMDKEYNLKNLKVYNALIKHLQQQKMNCLSRMSDPEKTEKIKSVVSKIHGCILEYQNSLEQSLGDILNHALQDEPETLEFFHEIKHNRFYGQETVFEEYSEHPVQKRLCRNKLLSKRSLKSMSTSNKYVNHLYESNHRYLLNKAISDLTKKSVLSELKAEMLSDEIRELKELLKIPINKKDSHARILAYEMYQKHKDTLTYEDIASLFGVSRLTCIRWIKEVQDSQKSE